jgi:hypothetical protein
MKPGRLASLLPAIVALLLVGANGSCDPSAAKPDEVYGLTAESTLAQGCFAPLACPVALSPYIGGSFRLHWLAGGAAFDLYAVQDVYWVARIAGQDLPITGSGLYVDGVDEDRLRLDLRVGDAPPQSFDSGVVPSGPPGSSDIDITISINGQSYLDTVIDVRAIAFHSRAKGTPCGPSGLVCHTDTEVCVARTPVGPAIVYECKPVPQGCEQDRGCACAGSALCQEAFDVCTETGPNQLQCECPLCQ